MYKLIAIDLDGTLLDSYGEISNENKNAIKKAIEKGINVVLTSGRMSDSVKNLSLEIGADKYAISGNGAIIYYLPDNKIIYNSIIKLVIMSKLNILLKDNTKNKGNTHVLTKL